MFSFSTEVQSLNFGCMLVKRLHFSGVINVLIDISVHAQ